MTIGSIGLPQTILGNSVRSLNTQLDTLQQQLVTGKKSTSYSGMGVNEGFAVAARAQLSGIGAFADTMTKVTTVIGGTNTALQSMTSIGRAVQNAAASVTQTIGTGGQTTAQQTAGAQLSSMIGILNTQVGDRYIFSGSAISTPSVASSADILDGKGAAAGLKQVINERKQADLGTGTGRLVIAQPTATSVSLGEDVAGSPFGMKIAAIASTTSGVTTNPPSGSPATMSIDFGTTQPAAGDTVTFKLSMPDGTSEQITMAATTANPPAANAFTIGATPTDTATNLQAALTTSVTKLANTALVAASAARAGSDFFDSPPQRVSGTPLASATALVAGTPADTVQWYTGEAGAGPARASATSRIDQSISVQYGARANEDAIRNQLKTVAVFAAVTTSSSDPNGGAQIAALSQRVNSSLSPSTGQRISDIQGDLAAAQTIMKDAQTRQGQSKAMLQTIVDQAENITPNEVAAKILAVQNSLQASYQTTSMLSQLTLTKFL